MGERFKKLLLVTTGPLLALLMVLFGNLTPGNMQPTYMAAITIWVAWWWMTEAITISVTALLPFILIPLAGITDPQTIALQYMDQAIFLFLGGFLISIAIEKWGLHKRLSLGILAKIGSSRSKVLAGVMLVTYLISMWISNTATVLMMLPAVLAIVKHLPTEEDSKGSARFSTGLMLALAYAATIGGMSTLVGTPTNTIFYSYYNKNIEPDGLNFTNWFVVGFPVSILLLIAVFFILLLMFSGRKKHPLNKQFFKDQYNTLGKAVAEEKIIAILFASTALLWFTRADIDFGSFTFQGWGDLVGGNPRMHDSTVSVIMGALLFLIPSKTDKGSTLLVAEDFKKVPYSVLLLFGSGFALAKGFELSGLSAWLAGNLANIGTLHPLLIIFCIVTVVCIISELASNVASIQLSLPILASLCASTGLPAMEIMLPATLAASLGFMLPVATAANTIVYGSGYIKSPQMVRAGFWADFFWDTDYQYIVLDIVVNNYEISYKFLNISRNNKDDMENELISKSIPVIMLLVLGIIEAIGGLYFNDKRTKNDWTIELVSLLTLPTIVQPAIFILTIWIGKTWLPQYEDYFVNLAIGWQILAFLVLDDMTQYWWHRLSHSNRMMWKLHRPHHVVEEMGVLVTYRNAILYYAFMPGIWLSACLIFLGMGYVYLFYLPIKLAVILLAHSETKWDRFLYSNKLLSPIAWVVERVISTPSTHFAHHGLTAEDGVSHPNGNYGNLLFIWDMIFGTAKITRKYPTKFGAWNQIKEPWYVQLLFPLIRSKRPESELHSIRTKNDYDPSVDFKEFDS